VADGGTPTYPYIPNSAPETRAAMLDAIGVKSVEDLYASIPLELRFDGPLPLPDPFVAEQDLRRHVEELLAANEAFPAHRSFLGGGCWRHVVPAVCDEIASRSEFLTAYGGSAYANRGVFQAQFEYQSLMGELVGMDLVGSPTYDWGTAAASALLMASRATGRDHVVVPRTMSPTRRSQVRAATRAVLSVSDAAFDPRTGSLDLDHLEDLVSEATAAIYVEVPAYLGFVEPAVTQIAEIAHRAAALFVVGVDPSSLGVLEAPAAYGADLVCGELQPLGIRPHAGGGLAGFLAAPDREPYRSAYPSLLVSILPTVRGGEHGFDWVNFETVSYGLRESSRDFTGTTQVLWSIVAAVYLSVMGPEGMRDLGEAILRRTSYAAETLSRIPGVTGSRFDAVNFKEFVVSFDVDGPLRRVDQVNAALRRRGILGGTDLTRGFPELGESALFCVTEVHTKQDIDDLAAALAEAVP